MNTLRFLGALIATIPVAIGVLWDAARDKAAANHAILIRGSVLDPDNHPSKDR